VIVEPTLFGARSFADGLAAVKVGSRWGFMKRSGEMAVEPSFDDAKSFTEGRGAVAVDGDCRDRDGKKVTVCWGFVDDQGKMVIPARYASAEPFAHGLAQVEAQGGWGYVDTAGRVVWKPSM
jgi:hypothetical protein